MIPLSLIINKNNNNDNETLSPSVIYSPMSNGKNIYESIINDDELKNIDSNDITPIPAPLPNSDYSKSYRLVNIKGKFKWIWLNNDVIFD